MAADLWASFTSTMSRSDNAATSGYRLHLSSLGNLAGQPAAYIVKQVEDFKSGALSGRLRTVLSCQSHTADEQKATEEHAPLPDIETEKPAIGYSYKSHGRPLLGNCCAAAAVPERANMGTFKHASGHSIVDDAGAMASRTFAVGQL
jgi:hypothetical protein